MNTTTTWADGFGTWHARIASWRSPNIAHNAIRQELESRQASPVGEFDVEVVEETATTTTYREVWPDEYDLTSPASRQHWIETGHFLPVGEATTDYDDCGCVAPGHQAPCLHAVTHADTTLEQADAYLRSVGIDPEKIRAPRIGGVR